MEILHLKDWIQYIIFWIYIYICPWTNVLDITKFMSLDGMVLDVPSMDIVLSHYQHCSKPSKQDLVRVPVVFLLVYSKPSKQDLVRLPVVPLLVYSKPSKQDLVQVPVVPFLMYLVREPIVPLLVYLV